MTNKNYLLKYAVEYLSKYTSSKKNLEKKLKFKIQRITKEKKDRYKLYQQIQNIIQQLEKNNILNDEKYTNNKIYYYKQGKSKNYIYKYLLSKGIDIELIKKEFAQLERQEDDWEEESAKIFAKKKNLIHSSESYEKRLGKMARAGFSFEISKKILN